MDKTSWPDISCLWKEEFKLVQDFHIQIDEHKDIGYFRGSLRRVVMSQSNKMSFKSFCDKPDRVKY